MTVTPPTNTGSRTAYGVTAPVRPTLTAMSVSSVVFSSGGSLNATAQRGLFAVNPAVRWSPRSSTLMTTPSIS